MIDFKIYMVSYDTLNNSAIRDITQAERDRLVCYAVNPDKPKFFQAKLNRVNEWELPWYRPGYQMTQYYEYGSLVHITQNNELLKGLSHVGLMHYDMYFPENSVNDIQQDLEKNPDQILYVIRRKDNLYFTFSQLRNVCHYLDSKLHIHSNPDRITEEGWISEALSVTPVDVFKRFGRFIDENKSDIEDIIRTNRWGIMDTCNHRVCGLVERFWGIYLVSLDMPTKQTRVIHDWDSYKHVHQSQKNWIIR